MLSICIVIKNRTEFKYKCSKLYCRPLYNQLFSIFCHRNKIKSLFNEYEVLIYGFVSEDFNVRDYVEKFVPINSMPIKVIFHKGDNTFNKGVGLNNIIGQSNGEYIFVSDVDMVFETDDVFIKAKEVLDSGKSYFPNVFKYHTNFLSGVWTRNGCGPCCYTKETYNRSKGYISKDTYGHEDTDFMKQCESLTGIVRGKIDGYAHCPHNTEWIDGNKV